MNLCIFIQEKYDENAVQTIMEIEQDRERLMADIRAAYKGREVQSIRERQKKAAQKKRRSLER